MNKPWLKIKLLKKLQQRMVKNAEGHKRIKAYVNGKYNTQRQVTYVYIHTYKVLVFIFLSFQPSKLTLVSNRIRSLMLNIPRIGV